jgi:nitrogen fixation-related uncharacterized protein
MKNWTLLLVIAVSIVLGVWYMALGLKARQYLTEKASSSDRAIGWLFWWCFDTEQYNSEGQKICKQGQLLAIPILGMYAAWYFVLAK